MENIVAFAAIPSESDSTATVETIGLLAIMRTPNFRSCNRVCIPTSRASFPLALHSPTGGGKTLFRLVVLSMTSTFFGVIPNKE